MHDRNGRLIKKGDIVKIEYEVVDTSPGTDYCNVTLRPVVENDGKMGSAGQSCNSRYTEMVRSAPATRDDVQRAAEEGFRSGQDPSPALRRK